MTIKQRLFIGKYFEHNGNGTKAVLDVYDTKDSSVAAVIASRNRRIPEIEKEINRLFDIML